jgi:type I restriction enzyme S subunit
MSKQHSVSEGSDIDDWKQVRLADVATKRAENVDPEETDIERNVGLKHIEPNTPTPGWEPITNVTSTKRRFYPGDILFAKLRPNLEKAAQPDFDGVCSTDIFTIEAGEDVNSKYLLYRLSSKPSFDWARRTSAGTRMPRTSWEQFSNFEFKLPPLKEQRKIATILHNLDEYIKKNEKIVLKTEKIKKGVAQDLFQTGLTDEDTKDTWVGRVPSHWEVTDFSNIVEFAQNGVYKSEDEYGGDYPIIKMGDIFGGATLQHPIAEQVHLSDEEINKYGVNNGDLIFARHAQGAWGAGDCTAVVGIEGPTVVESNMIHVRPKDDIHTMFYAQYFNTSVGERTMKRIRGTSNIASISQGDLMKLKVPVPPKDEQQEIATILSDFDDEIDATSKTIEQAKQLKRGLLQDLLTGDVRVNSLNIDPMAEVTAYE